MEKLAPPWLQELLDAEVEKEKKQVIEMSKMKADQALAAISVLETQINGVNELAEKEITLIQEWNLSEVEKIQKKIDWLVWNLENYMRGTGEKTITLPHGKIGLRMGRDKVEVVDMDRFMTIGQRLGLVRVTPAKTEPDLVAIASYTKLNGKPPAGVMLTPGQPKFSYKTKVETDDEAQAPAHMGQANAANAA